MPDLDLIKQEEQGLGTGACSPAADRAIPSCHPGAGGCELGALLLISVVPAKERVKEIGCRNES